MSNFKTTSIKGKPYVMGKDRVLFFRENYPGWAIESEMVKLSEGRCVIRTLIKDPNGVTKSTGYAEEKEGSTNINTTSFIENCETSAVGRALGMFGIGIDASMASADEVANAIDRQEALKQKVTKSNVSALKMLAETKGSDLAKILSFYEVERVEDMTMEQWQNAMNLLNRKK